MEEQKLRQLFKNRSNCYVDTDDVVQGMDEDCFVETVKEILHLYDVVERSEQLAAFLKWYYENDECPDLVTYEAAAERFLSH